MENKWAPSYDFEDEILAIQRECDVTFDTYPCTESTMATELLQEYQNEIPDCHRDTKLIQKIKEPWPSSVPIGMLATPDYVLEAGTQEYEIRSMMRRAGLEPSIEEYLTSERTIPPISSKKSYLRDSLPILLDDNYFKFKPRKSISSTASSSNSSNNSSTDFVLNSSVSDEDLIESVDKLSIQRTPSTSTATANLNMTINSSKSKTLRKRIGIEFSKTPTDNTKFLREDGIASARQKLVFLTPKELYRRKRPQVICL